MRCVLGRCYAFVILKHHQQLKFGCSLELCRVSVTFNNTSYTDSQNRITATQLHPQHHNKERDYTGCTTKPYLFDTSTSTQQTAQAFLIVFLSRPPSSFNEHNTMMVINDVIFSIPLLLVLPKVNPDFSIYTYFFLWGRDRVSRGLLQWNPKIQHRY